ncbi:unnamed protein product [Rotaria socialis]|uniref:Uncharacterized protein n=2 Tax=Rotaria socialis TaxID=392032 RepID=A0A818RNA9_9BILA|nr:unnamed protein product [Rotaria socialis]CAF3660155.1 unnamed protein product [Rotaria socialis]CAF3677153.1 unnamed protein product [Rotaria socialis]CAF4304172.1 unnamed protein product [Rotaria socialis]CAF4479944.1 unnamed protein product [Rotaria socialis]
MPNTSYANLLSNMFCVHISLPRKTNMAKSQARTGYAAAYLKAKHYHRRQQQLNLCSRILSFCKPNLFDNNESKLCRKRSSIRGCASFARYDRYQGDTEEDC